MTTARTLPTLDRASDLTTLTVTVDGEALPGTIGIVSVDLMRGANRIPTLQLVVHDGDAAEQDFVVSSGEHFIPGRTLAVEAGYGSDRASIFTGVITSQRIRARRRGGTRLLVEAKDRAFRMALDRKSRYFADLSDADLFEELIGAYDGLTADVEATTGSYPEIVQYQATDWDLLVTRAERIGRVCLLDDGRVRVVAPDPGQEPVLGVTYGTGLFDLDMELDARTQVASVTASAWDQAGQEMLRAEADHVDTPGHGNLDGAELAAVGGVESLALRHTGPLAQEELDAWAEAGLARSRWAKIRGTVRFQGTGAVRPGDVIEIGGAGERFSGRAFVSGVRHHIGRGDWETTVQVGFDPRWHHERFPVNAAPAAGLHPCVNGLQIGVVTRLQDDPAGEHRIQVRLPVIDDANDGVWTRVATLDAGDGRGSFFRPEIGDEVVVGFLNDDPRHPVVLGMLNSRAKPAPLEAADDNHEKGFVTRSGIKILFDDDGQVLRLETPRGREAVLDDDAGSIILRDGDGNSLSIDASGIAIESARDLSLKATGNISIEGTNIDLKANASLKAEGSASAAVSSSGSTEVQGAIVRIN